MFHRMELSAADTYKKYGETDTCKEGKGNNWASSVYEVLGEYKTRDELYLDDDEM